MSDIKRDIIRRVYFVYFLLCLFGLAIFCQIINIQFYQGEMWREKAEKLTYSYRNIEAARGNIYSAGNELLSTSIPIYDIRMDLRVDGLNANLFEEKVDSLAYCLSDLFKDKTEAEYSLDLRRARVQGKRYHLIKSNVTYRQLQSLKNFPIFRRGQYKGGLIIEQKSKREKPFRLLAERTIGYARDNVQPVGIEGAFDDQLKGRGGKRLMQRISGGVWRPVNDENEIEPLPGSDVLTTIDLNIQDVAETALYSQMAKYKATKGCAVVMEVKTGEIKAIANLSRKDDGSYREDYNYAIGFGTEPGSTFKLASVMAAIEDGYIEARDTVDARDGWIMYSGKTLKDSKGGYGKITLQRAFEISSNVAISDMVYKFYRSDPQKFLERIYDFGLNQPLGLQIKGEANPRIKHTKDKDWSGISLPYISIGYESKLTPLQILTFYNAIANDGKMVKPLLVKEISKRGKTVNAFSSSVIKNRIASKSTIGMVRSMLEGVVENGTANNLKFPEYKIAGKTGTAQMAHGSGGYGKQKDSVRYQASFAGYFPAENPQYSCIVVVYDLSRDFYYGNIVAGPVFKEIANKVYATRIDLHPELQKKQQLLAADIPRVKKGLTDEIVSVLDSLRIPCEVKVEDAQYTKVSVDDNRMALQAMIIEKDKVPDVRGMGLKDAIYLLESKGMKVRAYGYGKVKSQSLSPGSGIIRKQEIIIELS